jgi:hypothetical protein
MIGNIRLVDDDPNKGIPGEEHLFMYLSKWEGNMEDMVLSELLKELMNKHGSL